MIDLAEELQAAAPRPERGFDAEAVRRQAGRRTHRQRLLAGAAVAMVVLVVAAGAVVIGGRDSTPASVQVGGHPDPLAGAAPRSWVRLLGRVPVPAPDPESQIVVTDLAAARERTGAANLPLDASQDAWAAHLRALHLEALNGEPSVAPNTLLAELGFNQTQFDQVISWFEDGDRYIAVGRFDPASIDAAVAADPVWGPQAEATSHRGVRYYRWGKDRALSRTTSPARPVGQGGRLVVGDGWIAWADRDAAAEATIDAFLDPTRSLAAAPSLRDAARAADDAQATQLLLLPYGQRPTVALRRPGTAEPPPIDTPVTLTASTRRDGAAVVDQMVIGYASEEQAHANLAAVETTWQALATGFGLEVAQRGTVVVATVHHAPDQEIPGATVDGKVQQNLNLLNFSWFFAAS